MSRFLVIPSIFIGLYVYWFLYTIAIAIWVPSKAKDEWLAMSKSMPVQYGYFLFKWVAPLCLLLGVLSILVLVVQLVDMFAPSWL